MSALLSLGLAVPPHDIPQEETAEFSARLSGSDEESLRRLRVLYHKTGVRRRGSVLMDATPARLNSFFTTPVGPPTTAARMNAFREFAAPLAAMAAREALDSANVAADRVGFLVAASCTGFDAPGLDISLIDRLGLNPSVSRTQVGFMGCHGAINALRVAGALVAAEPGSTALVSCCELCSLHFEASQRPDALVANALFADGAAACVIGASGDPGSPRLLACGSFVVPGTRDAMGWRIGDHGFQMSLSPRVPDLIGQHLRPWLSEWLGARGLTIGSVGGWAVHPGGPRILEAVQSSLALGPTALDDSRAVLAAHGNMSSPTVLFILKRLLSAGKTPAVLLAFGPGLTVEAALVG